MKRTLLIFFLLMSILSCENKESATKPIVNEDSLRVYAQTILNDSSGWIMMSQAGICWICNGYFYYLGRDIAKKTPMKLVLLTHKFRKAAKQEMYDGLGWKFDANIRHLEDSYLYKKLGEFSGGEGNLIHITPTSITSYPINDRDAMDEQWPEIEKIIREGS